jgi:cation transport regulator ChaB
MAQSTVMRYSENERALGTLASKVRQRLPDCQRNILYQLFASARHQLVARSKARNNRAVVRDNAVKLLL